MTDFLADRPPRLTAEQSAALFDVTGVHRAPRTTIAAIVETTGATRAATRAALDELAYLGLVQIHTDATPTHYAPTHDGRRAVQLLMQRRTNR